MDLSHAVERSNTEYSRAEGESGLSIGIYFPMRLPFNPTSLPDFNILATEPSPAYSMFIVHKHDLCLGHFRPHVALSQVFNIIVIFLNRWH